MFLVILVCLVKRCELQLVFLEEKKNISHTHPLQALNFHFEVSNEFFFPCVLTACMM